MLELDGLRAGIKSLDPDAQRLVSESADAIRRAAEAFHFDVSMLALMLVSLEYAAKSEEEGAG